jgi:hypothetical protein
MDFRETFREIWIGTIYLFDKIRGKQPKPDLGIIREGYYESAFGRQRPLPGRLQRSQLMPHGRGKDDGLVFPVVEVEVDQEFEINGHRQWLSLDKYDRFNHPKRDRSEGLQEQIEQELEKRGYPRRALFLWFLHTPKNSSHAYRHGNNRSESRDRFALGRPSIVVAEHLQPYLSAWTRTFTKGYSITQLRP